MREEALKPLTRHPHPETTESRRGYELRLSETNGYRSPWSLYEAAGFRQYQFRGAVLPVNVWALITGCNESELQRIAYADPQSPRAFTLLGHPVVRSDLELAKVRLCPQCVGSLGFIEACWDLRLMVGCPVHSCSALTSCPGCSMPLTWFRPGLLRCRCGALLGRSISAELPPPTAALLDVLRRKVLRLLPFADEGVGFPAEDLAKLDLRLLLRAISVLGSSYIGSSNGTIALAASSADLMSGAARVLSSWPEHFFELLAGMRSRELPGDYDVRRQFAPLFNSLLKRTAEVGDGYLFLRRAFLSYVSERWPSRVADPRLMGDLVGTVARRYVSRTEVARLNQATERAVARVTKSCPPGVFEAQNGRIIVDRQTYVLPAPIVAKVLRIREAAASIGIPVGVLRALRESGTYQETGTSSGLRGFHEADVLRFRNRLVESAANRPLPGSELGDSIMLWDYMRREKMSCKQKASLIDVLLTGRLSFSLPLDGNIRLLAVRESQVRDLIAAERKRSSEITGLEACSLLGCDFDTLRALVKSHYVTGTKSGGIWRISRSAAVEFNHTYVPVAQLALDLGTSSRLIERTCSAANIKLVRFPIKQGRTRLYVCRRDAKQIMKARKN